MGLDYSVYVGPYIKVYNPRKPATKECYCCPNRDCTLFGKASDAKYCRECGNKIKNIELPSTVPIRFDVYDEFDDRLSEVRSENQFPVDFEECQIYIANSASSDHRHFDPRDSNFAWCIDRDRIRDSVPSFYEKYEKEINRLAQVFGEKNVRVEFGVISWIN